MGVPLPFRLRGSSLPVAWILILCAGCALGCPCSLGSYFKTGHKGGQGASVLSPKALPLAQAPPPAMGIFLLAGPCWVTSENKVCVGRRSKHIRVENREVVSVEVGISAAFCFSEHSISRSVRTSSLCAGELSHRLGEAAEAQPLPFCQVFRF